MPRILQQIKRSSFQDASIVYGVTVALGLSLLGWIYAFGTSLPFFDDWGVLAPIVGVEPFTWNYLTQDLNGHSLVLTKALGKLCWVLADGQYPLCSYLSCGLLLASTAFFLETIKSIRNLEPLDSFIPIALLHLWGATEYFRYWSPFFVFITIFCISVSLWCLTKQTPTLLRSCLLATCIAMLPTQGGFGLASSPPILIAGLLYVARLHHEKNTTPKRHQIITLLGVIAGLIFLTMFATQSMENKIGASADNSFASKLISILQNATLSLGYFGPRLWPVSGVFFLTITIAGIGLAITEQNTGYSRWQRIFAMLAFASTLMVPVAISVARGDDSVTASRFNLPNSTIAVCLYVLLSYCNNSFANRLRFLLFFVGCAFLVQHASLGLELGKTHRQEAEKIRSDISLGLPLDAVAARNADYWTFDETLFRNEMQRYGKIGIEPFASINNHQKFSRVEATHDLEWIIDDDEYKTFKLKTNHHPRVSALRLSFDLDKPIQNNMTISAKWPSSTDPKLLRDHPTVRLSINNTGPPRRTRTTWIDSQAAYILVSVPKNNFKLTEVSLLVPE